jgi:MFS family permease
MSKAKSAGALVAFMWFAYFLNYCDRQAVFSMFPSLKADLKMTDQELGLVGAMFLWVYAFGCPISGYLGDRFSKRLLVVLSLVVWSLVTLATGWARSGSDILALRGAMGISESLFMPTAIALTANAHPPALRSRAIAILTTAQIAVMTTAQIAALTTEDWAAFSTAQIVALTPTQIPAIATLGMRVLSTAQISASRALSWNHDANKLARIKLKWWI